MKKLTFNLIAIFSIALLAVSCGDTGGKSSGDGEKTEEIVFEPKEGVYETKRKKNINKIFRALPSVVEMAELIKDSGAEFNLDVLNSSENVDNYLTGASRAINLGIYGADLSYTMMFEQEKQNFLYFDAVTNLAEKLDVAAALESGLVDRIKNNKENQDSLMSIITETYWSINAYLKESEAREEVSALVIAGGWMEGLYLAGKHYTPDNTQIRERIAEQKYALQNLVDLMDTYDAASLNDIKADLKEVHQLYKDVEITKGKTTKEKDASGMVVLGGERNISMDDVTLQKVLSKIEELRNKYIK